MEGTGFGRNWVFVCSADEVIKMKKKYFVGFRYQQLVGNGALLFLIAKIVEVQV